VRGIKILLAIIIALLPVFYIVDTAKADYSKYNSNVFFPFSNTGEDNSKFTTIYHEFKINTIAHRITFSSPFKAYRVDAATNTETAPERTCWKMTDSDYFTISGDHYLCTFAYTGSMRIEMDIKEGEKLKKEATLEETSNYHNEYINYINTDPSFVSRDKSEILNSYFTDHVYEVEVIDKGSVAPVIKISASSEVGRPELRFQLTKVGGWSGTLSAEENNFYFTSTSIDGATVEGLFKNLALKIRQDGKGNIIQTFSEDQLQDTLLREGNAEIKVSDESWLNFVINRVYNGKSTEFGKDCGSLTVYDKTAEPPYTAEDIANRKYRKCINTDSSGWLAKWGVEFNKGSLSNPAGAEDPNCGSMVNFSVSVMIAKAFCSLGVMLNQAATSFLSWAVGRLDETIGLEY